MGQSKNYQSKKRKTRQRNSGSMPLLLTLGGFVLVAVALYAVWVSGKPTAAKAPVEVTGQPSLKVDQEKIDLGQMKLNSVAKVDVQVSNVGDQPLEIAKKPYVEVVEGC